MDEQCFSLNLEYSHKQNFKIFAVLKLYLKYSEIVERYNLVSIL
jgi:hypothetical protein